MDSDNGNDGPLDPEFEESGVPTVIPSDSEVSTQVATARRYPRQIALARKKAMEMATLDEETAAGCFYNLPRAGKKIAGPSARLAEIVAMSWGNIRFGGRVLDHDDKVIRAQGMCWDLENNAAYTCEVTRRITEKNGRTFNDDMIGVTGNAANSIAMRNAVLKIVPGVFWKPVYEAARKTAIGNATTLARRRTAAIEYFAKMDVSVEQLLAAVGKASIEEIGLDELETLTGLKTAIKEGDTTIEQAFPPAGAAHAPGNGGGNGNPKPQRKSERAPEAPAPAAEPEVVRDPEPPAAAPVAEPVAAPVAAPAAAPVANGEKPSVASIGELWKHISAIDAKEGKGTALTILEQEFGVRSVSKLNAAQAEAALEKLADIAGSLS